MAEPVKNQENPDDDGTEVEEIVTVNRMSEINHNCVSRN